MLDGIKEFFEELKLYLARKKNADYAEFRQSQQTEYHYERTTTVSFGRKKDELSPEERQRQELRKEITKLERLFTAFMPLDTVADRMDALYYNSFNYHSSKPDVHQFLHELYGNTFRLLYDTPLTNRLLNYYVKGELIDDFPLLKQFYSEDYIKTPHFVQSSRTYSIEDLFGQTGRVVFEKPDPASYNWPYRQYNTFIPHLFFFVSYLRSCLENDDHRGFMFDRLMQHKDVLSLIARLIQLGEDAEAAAAFFCMEDFAQSKVEEMFAPVQPFIQAVEKDIDELEAHKEHLRLMEERRKQKELEEKIAYYSGDSLNIDKDKADPMIQDLLRKAEDLSNGLNHDD